MTIFKGALRGSRMKHSKWFSKWFILPAVAVTMIAALVVGGSAALFTDTETSNDSAFAAWTSTQWTQTSQADFNAGVLNYTSALASGNVQLTLGPFAFRGNTKTTTWEYDPLTDSWITTKAVAPGNVVDGGALCYDKSSDIYALQGGSTAFWRYDIKADSWSTKTAITNAVGSGAALACQGSTYVYAFQGGNTKNFYQYSISGNSWSAMTAITGRENVGAGGSLAYDGSDYIYALKGGGQAKFLRYSISGNSWTGMTDATNSINAGGALVYDGSNYIYALAGGNTNKFMQYSISGNSWAGKSNVTANVSSGGALVYDGNNYIYAFRGNSQTTFYRYSISGNSWTTMTAAPATVSIGGALTGMVVVGQVASQVLDTTVTGSRWDALFWNESLATGTDITFEVRASDTLFLKGDSSPSWTSVGGTSPVLTGLTSGRYKQWRATLTSNGSQTNTPTLQEVRVFYYGG